jgi:RNA polymerase sigma-70 factor (ECF subfamily)
MTISSVPELAPFDAASLQLVKRFQAGEPEAFKALFLLYAKPVRRYARMVLRDWSEAEDVFQETLSAVYDALPAYTRRGSAPFRGWVFAIARHKLLDELARRRRLAVWDPEFVNARREEDRAGLFVSNLILNEDVAEAIDALPLAQRQVVLYRFFLGLDREEVARQLARSAGAVRNLQQRALDSLELQLAASGYGALSPGARRSHAIVRRPPVLPVLRARREILVG